MGKINAKDEMKNIEELREMPMDILFEPFGKEYTLRGLIKHLMGIYIFNGDMPVCFECNRKTTFTHYENASATFNKKMAVLDAYDNLGIEITIN